MYKTPNLMQVWEFFFVFLQIMIMVRNFCEKLCFLKFFFDHIQPTLYVQHSSVFQIIDVKFEFTRKNSAPSLTEISVIKRDIAQKKKKPKKF